MYQEDTGSLMQSLGKLENQAQGTDEGNEGKRKHSEPNQSMPLGTQVG